MAGNYNCGNLFWSLQGRILAYVDQNESILNNHPASVYAMFGTYKVNNFTDDGPKQLETICSQFLAPIWPTWDQRGPNANQFWTLTKQEYTPRLK